MQTQEASVKSVAGYSKILVPHDGSEMSDRALGHAAYIAKATGAQVTLMNVIETDIIPPSLTLAFLGKDNATGLTLKQARERLKSTLEGGVRQMLEQRVQACKDLLGERTVKPSAIFLRHLH